MESKLSLLPLRKKYGRAEEDWIKYQKFHVQRISAHLCVGLQVSFGYLFSCAAPVIGAAAGPVQVALSNYHQPVLNLSHLTLGKSGSNKTSVINFMQMALEWLMWCIHSSQIKTLAPNFKFKTMKNILVDGGTLNAIEDQLSNTTGEGDPKKLNGEQYSAGSGAYLNTELFQQLQSISNQSKSGTNVDWLCQVTFYIYFCIHIFFLIFIQYSH